MLWSCGDQCPSSARLSAVGSDINQSPSATVLNVSYLLETCPLPCLNHSISLQLPQSFHSCSCDLMVLWVMSWNVCCLGAVVPFALSLPCLLPLNCMSHHLMQHWPDPPCRLCCITFHTMLDLYIRCSSGVCETQNTSCHGTASCHQPQLCR